MLCFTRIHKEPKSLELFWEFSLAKSHAVHAESGLFSLVHVWGISRIVVGGSQVWRYMIFLIKKSVHSSPGMINRAEGLKGIAFMGCSALIFLGWWQLGIPSRRGPLDVIRKERDIAGVGELMWRTAFLCIWQDQAGPVGICRLAGKMCLHFHEGELCHLQENWVAAGMCASPSA